MFSPTTLFQVTEISVGRYRDEIQSQIEQLLIIALTIELVDINHRAKVTLTLLRSVVNDQYALRLEALLAHFLQVFDEVLLMALVVEPTSAAGRTPNKEWGRKIGEDQLDSGLNVARASRRPNGKVIKMTDDGQKLIEKGPTINLMATASHHIIWGQTRRLGFVDFNCVHQRLIQIEDEQRLRQLRGR